MDGLGISGARSTKLEREAGSDYPALQATGCSACYQTKHLASLMVISRFYGITRCPLCFKSLRT
jgi:hypothetical protein